MLVGKVTYYYPKIGVVVVELQDKLSKVNKIE